MLKINEPPLKCIGIGYWSVSLSYCIGAGIDAAIGPIDAAYARQMSVYAKEIKCIVKGFVLEKHQILLKSSKVLQLLGTKE